MPGRISTSCLCFCILWIALALLGCDQPLIRNDLEAIQARGYLVVATRNNSACYYQGPNGAAGFEYDLVKAFADSLGVGLRPLVLENEADMVEALHQGKADIMAAGILLGHQTAQLVARGPGYLDIQQLLVGRRGGPAINNIEDTSQTIIGIAANSAQIDLLRALQAAHKTITWQIYNDTTAETMLELVWNRTVPLTIIESNQFKLNHRFFPELVAHMSLGPARKLTWAINSSSRQLQHAVNRWFALSTTREFINGLKNHYFSHLDEFDYVDLVRYRKRIGTRLPQYRPFFEAAAKENDFDWQLIAAQSYQESHWDPRAVSFSGVRGIMMVTRETAKDFGLDNRLEAEEGIFAGTRYLARLHHLLDDSIAEPDRTFLALAAYNIGLGHLQDARKLARNMGKSDKTWRSIRSVLPMLRQKKYYQDLDYGYARGAEAVTYVDHIRTYHKVMAMTLAAAAKKNEPMENQIPELVPIQ